MGGVLLDTHAVIWYLSEPEKLSKSALSAIDSAFACNAPLYISAISLVEIIYLGEKRRISQEAVTAIIEVLTGDNGFIIIPLDEIVAITLATIPRDAVPDMPDRIIVATTKMVNTPIVTKDSMIIAAKVVATVW